MHRAPASGRRMLLHAIAAAPQHLGEPQQAAAEESKAGRLRGVHNGGVNGQIVEHKLRPTAVVAVGDPALRGEVELVHPGPIQGFQYLPDR